MGGELLDIGYATYRSLVESPLQRFQGMEFEGLSHDDFRASMRDPRALLIETQTGEVVPLAVPVEQHSWLNEAFYRANPHWPNADTAPLYYVNHLADEFQRDPASYGATLFTLLSYLNSENGALAVDNTSEGEQVGRRDLHHIASRFGFRLKDRLGKEPPIHYQYVGRIASADPFTEGDENPGLFQIYEEAVRDGRIPHDGPLTASVEMADEDIEFVWAYYSQRFGELGKIDPVLPGFDEQQFVDIMRDPSFIKMHFRDDSGNIINVCLLSDVRSCDWLNQAYYRQHHADYYDRGLVLTSPGIIAEDSARARGLSLATMGLGRDIFEAGGLQPTFTFICDEVSNVQVPRLTELSLNRSGQFVADFQYPRTHQLFHLYTVETQSAA